MKEHIVIMIS